MNDVYDPNKYEIRRLKMELLEVKQKLFSCEHFMQVRFAWSVLWAKKATSEVNYARNVTDGDGRPYTQFEKEKDAINTASNHIQLMEETLQEIYKLHKLERDLTFRLIELGVDVVV